MYHYLEANVVIERIVRHLQWSKFSLLGMAVWGHGKDDKQCRLFFKQNLFQKVCVVSKWYLYTFQRFYSKKKVGLKETDLFKFF